MASIPVTQFVLAMFCIVMLLPVPEAVESDEEMDETSPEDKEMCVREFRDWCQNTATSSKQMDTTLMFFNSFEFGRNVRINCRMDFSGAKCFQNSLCWFHCLPSGTLMYKGRELEDDIENIDDDICYTWEKAEALFGLRKLTFNETFYEEQMKSLAKRMKAHADRMNAHVESMRAQAEEFRKTHETRMKFHSENMRAFIERMQNHMAERSKAHEERMKAHLERTEANAAKRIEQFHKNIEDFDEEFTDDMK